ncbi:cysteine-rich domain-containing protein [Nocardia nova SH22a]|uniref:Cysteine-rich domain-containing protein n=1 Tax=Nocardia nova SH22a TaxID=1415166 RepID=W5TC49_9NOCA|nr:(Fe-S)-binding protein [Nocardia nova]AHH16812.1 cysteine-rich domain-containing protein [Nocardia nova SH22a]
MSERTALFITCVNDVLYPGTGRAAVKLLRRLGVEVEFPMAQSCCGQMHANTGYRAETATLARHFVEVFGVYDRIVVPSASCGAAPGEFYRTVAEQAGDPILAREAQALLPRIRELTEFLTDDLGVHDVGAYFPHRVTYHPTCHSLRVQRIGERPYRLLRAVAEMDLIELPAAEECCGFGGTFSVKNAAASGAMNGDKAAHIRETGASVVTAVDNSCLMNIGGRLVADASPVRNLHLVEILARTKDDGPMPGLPVVRGEGSRP